MADHLATEAAAANCEVTRLWTQARATHYPVERARIIRRADRMARAAEHLWACVDQLLATHQTEGRAS